MTAPTAEKLAAALDEIGLANLAARARDDEFHDFLSPHAMPTILLVDLLYHAGLACPDVERQQRIIRLRELVIEGEFDADKAESDAWAVSEEGQAAFNKLLGRDK